MSDYFGRDPYIMDNPIIDYPKTRTPMPKSFYVKCQEAMNEYHMQTPEEPRGDSEFLLDPRLEGDPMVTWDNRVVNAYHDHVEKNDGFYVEPYALPPKYAWKLNGAILPFDINLELDLVLSACNHAVEAFNQWQKKNTDDIGQLKLVKVEECMIQLYTGWSHVLYLTFNATLDPRGDSLTCQAKVVLDAKHVLAFRLSPPPFAPNGDKRETEWSWKEEYVAGHAHSWDSCECVERMKVIRKEEEAKNT